MPSDPVKAFSFLFYIQITSETHKRAKRGTHRHAKRERERERRTHRCSGTVERERERERKRERERRESRESEQWPNPRRSGKIAPSSSRRQVLSSRRWSLSFSISLSLLNRVWSSPICLIADHSLANLLSCQSLSRGSTLSPICLISLISDFFFFW